MPDVVTHLIDCCGGDVIASIGQDNKKTPEQTLCSTAAIYTKFVYNVTATTFLLGSDLCKLDSNLRRFTNTVKQHSYSGVACLFFSRCDA